MCCVDSVHRVCMCAIGSDREGNAVSIHSVWVFSTERSGVVFYVNIFNLPAL
jgi:hypothetical protein